ncbi:proline dehydrogenase family protein, partial [Vibrio parahaemolyticus VPTS-2010_2]
RCGPHHHPYPRRDERATRWLALFAQNRCGAGY